MRRVLWCLAIACAALAVPAEAQLPDDATFEYVYANAYPELVYNETDSPTNPVKAWKPKTVEQRRPDGTQVLSGLRWRSWGRPRVVGHGTGQWCPADGSPCQRGAATIVLDRLRWTYYTRYSGPTKRSWWRTYFRATCSIEGVARPCAIAVPDFLTGKHPPKRCRGSRCRVIKCKRCRRWGPSGVLRPPNDAALEPKRTLKRAG